MVSHLFFRFRYIRINYRILDQLSDYTAFQTKFECQIQLTYLIDLFIYRLLSAKHAIFANQKCFPYQGYQKVRINIIKLLYLRRRGLMYINKHKLAIYGRFFLLYMFQKQTIKGTLNENAVLLLIQNQICCKNMFRQGVIYK